MTTRPTHDHVYIRPDRAPERTDGGIIIPETSQEEYRRGVDGRGNGAGVGTVVRVGPGEVSTKTGERQAMELRPGDRVLFEPYAGMEREIDGEKLLVMEENHVLGVFE
jgi:chaperonin GroES